MFRSYTILVQLLLIFVNTAYPQQYWIPQQCPTTKYLTKIVFTDSLFGWAAGDSGAVIRTTNGGSNWAVLNSNTDLLIDDIYFLNNQTGWILSNDYFFGRSYFFKTINGGFSWFQQIVPDTAEFFLTVYFRDALTGFLGGRYGSIFRTTNSGADWKKCSIDSAAFTTYPLRKIKFYDSARGYACGGIKEIAGAIWTTSNGGANWKIGVVSPEPDWDFNIINSEKVIFIGGDFEFGTSTVVTNDHGMHLQYDTIGCRGMATAIAFRTPAEAWAPLTYSQLWAVNLDSGAAERWFSIAAPESTVVFDAKFLSPTFGWACGFTIRNGNLFLGTLLKYNTDIIGINDPRKHLPDAFTLFQNYPNPFNPATTIRYYLPKASDVEISYFDVTGKLVAHFQTGADFPGFHVITFNGDNLSSGVYFYRMKAGEFTDYKKMVLIK